MAVIEESDDKITYVAEVFLFVPWRGQARFRMFMNDGVIVFGASNRQFDRKIEAMSGRNVARMTTTHELVNFMESDNERKSHIMLGFRDLVKSIENPLQYLDKMYRMEYQSGDEKVEAYIFPLYK